MFAVIDYETEDILAFRTYGAAVARVLEPGTVYGEGATAAEALAHAEQRARHWRKMRAAAKCPSSFPDPRNLKPDPSRAA